MGAKHSSITFPWPPQSSYIIENLTRASNIYNSNLQKLKIFLSRLWVSDLRHPYLQACKQGWVRSTLPSPPHFFGKSVLKTSLSTLWVFRFFGRLFQPLRESAPHHKLKRKNELEGKIKDYSKIFKFPSNFNDIRRNQNYIMQQNTEDVF